MKIANILRSIADSLDPQPQESVGDRAQRLFVEGVSAPDYPPNIGYLNPTSPTWFFIRGWADEKLQRARNTNDSVNCDVTKTAVLRGEIKIIKELLALPNPKKGLLLDEEVQSY